MSFFRQIIFPPKPTIIMVGDKSNTHVYAYYFDRWFVGTNPDSKVLYVRCPTCGFVYEYLVGIREAAMRVILEEYEPFHYREVIRKCPAACKHVENVCPTISGK